MADKRIPAAAKGTAKKNPGRRPGTDTTGRPMTYGQWRTADEETVRRRNAAKTSDAPRHAAYKAYNSGGEIRQMHIPIPVSQNGRYPGTGMPQNQPRDEKAQALRGRLEKKEPQPVRRVQPVYNRQPKASPVREAPKNAAPRKKPAANKTAPAKKAPAKKQEWAIPENSTVYSYTAAGAERPPRPRPEQRNVRNEREVKLLAQRRAEKKAEKRQKTKFYVKAFFVRLAAVFIVCAGIFALIYHSTFSPHKAKTGSVDYSVKIGEKAYFTAEGGDAYRNGVMYINFSDLADSLNIVSVGSVDSMRFIVPDEETEDSAGTGREQYVIFSDGMSFASVNGTGIIMEAECRTSGLDVWVPFSFVENYVRGITAEKSGSSVVIKSTDEETDENGNVLLPKITFTMSKSQSLGHVDYPS